MRALRFVIPLLIFAAIAVFLLRGLSRDPREIPSPLVGKPAPAFALPTLADPAATWSPERLRGKVWLLNVWGSWCAACQVEHPLLGDLARRHGVTLVGLAWKDKPDAARAWLARLGDPYTVVVLDQAGRTAIDYGVYGAPETFVIDKRGVIRHKQIGPFTAETIRDRLLPLLAALDREPG